MRLQVGDFRKASNHRSRASPGVEKKQRRVSNAIKGSKRKRSRRLSVWSADLGPFAAVKRGFKTRERVLFSGGLSGVEFVSEDEEAEVAMEVEAGPSRTTTAPELPMLTVTSPSPRKWRKDLKGKGRAVDVSEEGEGLLTTRKSAC
jgi:hypothetical protein